MRRRAAAFCLGVAIVLAACGGGGDDDSADGEATDDGGAQEAAAPLANPYEDYTSEIYADPAHWLCRPDITESPCTESLDATAVSADGSVEVQRPEPVTDLPVDCFYVYPTISGDESTNSDLVPGPELGVAQNQASRFSEACRVFAPVYRSVTLGGIGLGSEERDVGSSDEAREIAFADVVDAWKHYIANDNDGRGVILIGHSQGSGMLSRLIADEIEGVPELHDRLVSALLLGTAISVPEGEDVGGTFEETPACRAADQTGCVVAYSTFRASEPPGDDALFGRPREGDGVAVCANPAALEGGAADLSPYFGADGAQPFADPAAGEAITTPWVTYPGLLSAECVERDGFSYLELTVNGDPTDPRTDDIDGDFLPGWGLHNVDVNIALGDLVELARSQAEAYTSG